MSEAWDRECFEHRQNEATEALITAQQVIQLACVSLARTGEDGFYFTNELTKVQRDITAHVKRIRALEWGEHE